MTSLAKSAPPVNPTRQRKPLLPVQVTGRFVGGATRQDVLDGAAVLSIVAGDDSDRDEKAYWCKALFANECCVGFSLTTFGTREGHVLSRDLKSCTCGDATYRPERPGGCRHQQAMRQALPTVSGTAPTPTVARKPNRRLERDEATAGMVASE